MPRRETNIPSSINNWEGVNQRLQPTLVPDGFFFFAKGVQFGQNNNVQRLTGKTVTDKFSSAIFGITAWGEFAIVQLYNSVVFYLTTTPPEPLTRITEAGDIRITEASDIRITE